MPSGVLDAVRAQLSHIDLRCPLFIPGNRRDMLAKAGRYSPSGFIPDMEDSVPMANKAEARAVTAEALPSLFELGKPVVPRVNSLLTGLTEDDLKAVVGQRISLRSASGRFDQPTILRWLMACCRSWRRLRD